MQTPQRSRADAGARRGLNLSRWQIQYSATSISAHTACPQPLSHQVGINLDATWAKKPAMLLPILPLSKEGASIWPRESANTFLHRCKRSQVSYPRQHDLLMTETRANTSGARTLRLHVLCVKTFEGLAVRPGKSAQRGRHTISPDEKNMQCQTMGLPAPSM